MTTPTHAAIGYLLAHAFVQNGLLPPEAMRHAVVLGILSANAPDTDCVVYWKIIHHRKRSPFHKPFLWSLVIIPILIFFYIAHMNLQFQFVLLAASGLFSHFLADSLDFSTGITWLWPFSNKLYHVWTYSRSDADTWMDLWNEYKWSLAMFMEIIIGAIALYVYYHS